MALRCVEESLFFFFFVFLSIALVFSSPSLLALLGESQTKHIDGNVLRDALLMSVFS